MLSRGSDSRDIGWADRGAKVLAPSAELSDNLRPGFISLTASSVKPL